MASRRLRPCPCRRFVDRPVPTLDENIGNELAYDPRRRFLLEGNDVIHDHERRQDLHALLEGNQRPLLSFELGHGLIGD